MTFVSFAQNYEDVMLWRALKHVERGFYIDVGAFSPDIDSVTRAFSERGWRGINIEPNPHFLAQLKTKRLHDTNLGVAISDSPGEIELSIVGDTGLTTVDPDLAQSHAEAGLALSRIAVQAVTLAQIWDQHVPASQPVHFLKVDVEGHEAAALRGGDWSRHRPWIVVVEATLPNTQVTSHAEWEVILTQADYEFVYWDGLNRFYVAKEHGVLSEAFSAPPNFFDDFVTRGHAWAAERIAELDGSVSRLNRALDERAPFDKSLQGLQRSIDSLARHNALLETEAKTQARVLIQAMEEIRSSYVRLEYRLGRSVWERILLRPSGRPRGVFRGLLFHKSGKPRGMFRRWVQYRDGRPRKLFHAWMTSASYQSLPYPSSRQRQLGADGTEHGPVGLSPRARYFLRRLKKSEAPEGVG